EIGSFDSLMRVMRILGELDIFTSFIADDEMSPNEYLEFVEAARKKRRKRAGSIKMSSSTINKEESEW
ncbi:MAG: hypothetical protein K2K47_09250, partial [Duncaniella sp.]|nr:hypothetical protein [Duncaniella sp.]